MKISRIIWLDEIIDKMYVKHNVSREEVREVLNNSRHFRFVEKGHQSNENVYSVFGKTDSGRRLIVFFVYKTNKAALIVSARDMTDAERKYHEKK